MWKGEHQGTEVAVKVLRVVSGKIDKVRSVRRRPKPSNSANGGAHYNCVEILQGSRDVEKSSPPKRAPIAGSDDDQRALRNDIGVDAPW